LIDRADVIIPSKQVTTIKCSNYFRDRTFDYSKLRTSKLINLKNQIEVRTENIAKQFKILF